MAIIKTNSKERDLLARLMRAEAVGEGDLGMLMVGNVVVKRYDGIRIGYYEFETLCTTR